MTGSVVRVRYRYRLACDSLLCTTGPKRERKVEFPAVRIRYRDGKGRSHTVRRGLARAPARLPRRRPPVPPAERVRGAARAADGSNRGARRRRLRPRAHVPVRAHDRRNRRLRRRAPRARRRHLARAARGRARALGDGGAGAVAARPRARLGRCEHQTRAGKRRASGGACPPRPRAAPRRAGRPRPTGAPACVVRGCADCWRARESSWDAYEPRGRPREHLHDAPARRRLLAVAVRAANAPGSPRPRGRAPRRLRRSPCGARSTSGRARRATSRRAEAGSS